MKEIELLLPTISSREDVLAALSLFPIKKKSDVRDLYFYHPKLHELDPDSSGRLTRCLRVRESDGKITITHKIDKFDGDLWLYSDETEFLASSFDLVVQLLKELGFKELIVIKMHKQKYSAPPYEIVYEEVEGLGNFLEIELCTKKELNIDNEKKKMRLFISSLGIKLGGELNQGKPELMLRQTGIFNKMS